MSSMSLIEIPGPDGPLHLTTQQEVEQHHSEALALCFQLTAQSPFLVDPLWFELGLLGTSPAAQAILQGTYLLNNTKSLNVFDFLISNSLSFAID